VQLCNFGRCRAILGTLSWVLLAADQQLSIFFFFFFFFFFGWMPA